LLIKTGAKLLLLIVKVNPPVAKERVRVALIVILAQATFDVIETDPAITTSLFEAGALPPTQVEPTFQLPPEWLK